MNVVAEFVLWLKNAGQMPIAHPRNPVPLPFQHWDNVNVKMFAMDLSSVAAMLSAKLLIIDLFALVPKDSLAIQKTKKSDV